MPLLDHRVVELAWRQLNEMKVRSEQGKLLLRQVLYWHVSRELIERPKMGVGMPIDAWLRWPFRVWAEELLNENHFKDEGFLNPQSIRVRWPEHLNRQDN
jgi:asparagine synthase (glutamine-hydrolysing)